MSDVAIKVENLSKLYRIGAQQRHDTLRDSIVEGVHRLKVGRGKNGNLQPSNLQPSTEFWALKDVSFEVKRGEVVGIIGRNGAGKSTLLKILSRITEPTEGRAEIHGRVGSLLEVGTGFHQELTGRENIYLNGAILGMRRTEIAARFDEIVAFSEIEKFLDTPVKRYSSGMYVRLAFAVAAHLEPEILLVDEVLAVGDAQFQKKCLGKMGDVANEGRTVLFVSHNMAAVLNLCNRGLRLDTGILAQSGPIDDVTQAYMANLEPVNRQYLRDIVAREGNGALRLVDFRTADRQGQILEVPSCGQDITFEICYEASGQLAGKAVVISLGFYNLVGQPLFLCRSDLQGTEFVDLPRKGSVLCRIPKFPLPPGRFRINLHCEVNGVVADWIRDLLTIDVAEGDFYGSGRLPPPVRGDLLVEHTWLTPNSHALRY
jgi:lipopolysaccharide transport system ATP-binding protein